MIDSFVEKIQKIFEKVIRKCCPICKYLLYSKHGEHAITKGIFGFFYGIFLGIVFYEFILVDLDFAPTLAIIIGLFISLMLALGNALSTQIRCIGILTIPSFCGKGGRGVLKAISKNHKFENFVNFIFSPSLF